MANMCVGCLKVRGNKENIIDFVKNEFDLTYAKDCFELYNEDGFCLFSFNRHNFEYIFIKGLKCFISESCDVYLENKDHRSKDIDTDLMTYFPVESKWGIHLDDWMECSKKYNIDLKIYTFEKGLEFNLDIEISNGVVIKYKEITFDSYLWDCINPMLGG